MGTPKPMISLFRMTSCWWSWAIFRNTYCCMVIQKMVQNGSNWFRKNATIIPPASIGWSTRCCPASVHWACPAWHIPPPRRILALTRVLSRGSHSSKSLATSSVVEIIIAYLFSICAIHIYIYIPAKPKTQEFLGQSKITGYLDTALEISRAPLKFGFWGKNA